jgi:hypothetical protein
MTEAPTTPPVPEPEPGEVVPREHPEAADGDNDQADDEETDAGKRS